MSARLAARAVAILAFTRALVAGAEPEPEPTTARELSPPRRALAAIADVVPGLVVPGLGHFVAGDAKTGRRLLLTGSLGLGTALASGVGLALTGASSRTVAPFALGAVFGFGTLLSSVLADLHGVAVPDGARGRPAAPPELQSELGFRYVHDPTFAYRAFAAARLEARWGRLRLAPVAWIALDDDNQRFELPLGWRLTGDGASHLELAVGLVHHRYGSAAFSTATGEITLGGRLDLARLAAPLRGSFAELGGGFALGLVRHHDLTTEPTDLLLATAAFGVYLGDGRGEVALTYDDRHHGFAAGLKMPGLGSGPAGHFGVRARVSVWDAWGLLVEGQVGSAYVVGLSAVYRHGAAR